MGTRSRWGALLVLIAVLAATACEDADEPDEEEGQQVALLFVGHGEPAVCADGDESITLADGTPFGPHAASLGVPEEAQYTEWAAAYEEIATAMTYIFPDFNENGIGHELEIAPVGDVPPFFTWEAYRKEACEIYDAFDDYSPHNDLIADHVASLEVDVEGAEVETFLAFLDAVPRIADLVWEISEAGQYEKLVVVPLLLASSTHTQEVEELTHEAVERNGGLEVVVSEPYFEIPYVRTRIKNAVVAMADYMSESVPSDVADDQIGVILAAHGTPYVPPFDEFGWQEGEIFSNLLLTESLFHEEIAAVLPWEIRTGRMNFAFPTLEESLAAFEADGVNHVMVIPSVFPTAAMHTMWDVADAVVGRAVLPEEGVVEHTRESGVKVYYSAEGYADIATGRAEFRAGLGFAAKLGVLEMLELEAVDSLQNGD